MAEKRLRYSIYDDLCLLKEVVTFNPYEALGRWKEVHQRFIRVCKKDFTRRSVRDHTDHLLRLYEKNDTANLRKSGCEEQYIEKEELLQQLKQIVADRKKVRTRRKRQRKEVNDQKQQKRKRRKTSKVVQLPLPLPLQSVKVEPIEEESSSPGQSSSEVPSTNGSADTPAPTQDVASEVSESNQITSSDASKNRKRNQDDEISDAIMFLDHKQALDHELKTKELELEERRLQLDERKLKLEEEKFALEKVERLTKLQSDERKEEDAKRSAEQQFNVMAKLLEFLNKK